MKRCFSCFKEYDDGVEVCPFCGEIENPKPNEPIQLEPGTILAGRYMIGHSEGAGGFGIVYKAYDLKLETIVAVKEFFVSRLVTRAAGLKNVIVSKKSQEEYDYRKERFLAEARNMAKFGSHRSIPNVFEFFEENNTAYLVMELLQGMPLNAYLVENKETLDKDFAIMIANEVGNALKSLHEQNIIHKDVAPDNIFICSGKEIKIKLMDLGAAKLADSTDDVVDIVLKPGYSPAEQYDNSKNIGPWTDVYALGATMYVMLTGVKPDESTNRKIKDEVVPPIELNPDISENLSNAIMKAMAIDIHMRFKNVNEFLEAINGERKVVSLAKERKHRSTKRVIGIAVACLILSVGVFFGLRMYNSKKAEEVLKPADISVWFCVKEGSSEEAAMNFIKTDFEETFPGVTLDIRAIPESDYETEIEKSLKNGTLPTLFESSGLSDSILDKAKDLDDVIKSAQFAECLFLNQYTEHYSDKKQMPLAIEVPVAYVITNGAAFIKYNENYFSELKDFGENTNISFDARNKKLISSNFDISGLSDMAEFMDNKANKSPVLLSSTMIINEVRTGVTNYEKKYVYPNMDEISCNFIYEWSIGSGNKDEIDAAEKLLSWMLGNVYQSYLMISKCNDGQIPVNPICFESKIQSKNLAPINDIYKKFIFD